MEKLIDAFLTALEENDFMVNHEKQKVKEVSKIIKQLEKVNVNIENKVDVAPFIEEREQHLKQYTKLKIEQKKLYKMYRILIKDVEE